MNVPYEILVPAETHHRLAAYQGDLASRIAAPGQRLAAMLEEGHDYFGDTRCTDDGVKAAATDSMAKMTGVYGNYSADRTA